MTKFLLKFCYNYLRRYNVLDNFPSQNLDRASFMITWTYETSVHRSGLEAGFNLFHGSPAVLYQFSLYCVLLFKLFSVQCHVISSTWGPGLRWSSKLVGNLQHKKNWCDIHTIILCRLINLPWSQTIEKKFCNIFVSSYWLFLDNCDFMHLNTQIGLKKLSFVVHLCLTSYVVLVFNCFGRNKAREIVLPGLALRILLNLINNVFFDQNDWWSEFYAIDVTVKNTMKAHLDW